METKLYIDLRESKETGYIRVEKMYFDCEMEEAYENKIASFKKFGFDTNKIESFEGFKLQYVLANVKYDGRKGIKDSDALKSLEEQGLITKVAEGSIFGAYYHKTDKLKDIMEDHLNKRKLLAGVA